MTRASNAFHNIETGRYIGDLVSGWIDLSISVPGLESGNRWLQGFQELLPAAMTSMADQGNRLGAQSLDSSVHRLEPPDEPSSADAAHRMVA